MIVLKLLLGFALLNPAYGPAWVAVLEWNILRIDGPTPIAEDQAFFGSHSCQTTLL